MQTEGIKPKRKKKTAYNPKGKFPKSLWFDLSRKEEWEAMAKKEGKKLAAFIQDHVGDLQELEAYVKDLKEQSEMARDGKFKDEKIMKARAEGKVWGLSQVLKFIAIQKDKA